jgi:lipoprotein-releasing system permease protein
MNLSGLIARRYLVSKKSHNAINIISGISVAGICIGSAAMVIVLSALNGITALVLSLYNTFDPDIKVMPSAGKTFPVQEVLLSSLKNNPSVIRYSEVLEEKALVKYNDKQTIVTLKGVDQEFEKISRFDTVVKAGRYLLEADSAPLAIVGGGIAAELDLMPDEHGFSFPLHIYIPKKGNQAVVNPEDAFHTGITYPSGIFNLNDDFDYKFMIMPLHYVQELLEKSNEVSALEISLREGTDADAFAADLQKKLGGHYTVKTRYELNDVLFKTLSSEKWWTFLILAFILLIGTFNVIGSLTMLIIEKKKDIGILASMGADRALIRNIFMKEGFFITLIGAASGIVLGISVCLLQMEFKLIPFSEGFMVDAYPVKLIWTDIAFIFGTVMSIGFLASWYPVRLFTRRYFSGA